MKEFDLWFYLKSIGIDFGLMLGGLMGAFMTFRTNNGLTPFENAFTLVSGAVTSMYLTPFVCSVFDFLIDLEYSISFLIGYSGLKTIEYIIDKAHKIIDKKLKL